MTYGALDPEALYRLPYSEFTTLRISSVMVEKHDASKLRLNGEQEQRTNS